MSEYTGQIWHIERILGCLREDSHMQVSNLAESVKMIIYAW